MPLIPRSETRRVIKVVKSIIIPSVVILFAIGLGITLEKFNHNNIWIIPIITIIVMVSCYYKDVKELLKE
jgi:hypothetical protein